MTRGISGDTFELTAFITEDAEVIIDFTEVALSEADRHRAAARHMSNLAIL